MAWDYRFKYTFTGDSGVGKTTSIYSFLKKDTNNVASTIGVEYIMKTLKVGGNNIMLHIWDTAGQEAFRSIVQGFYRGSTAVFLMFDVTSPKSFHSLEIWLKDITVNSHTSTIVVLVGNKIDLESKRKITKVDAEAFAKNHNLIYYETSGLTGAGIEKMMVEITETIHKKITTGEINIYDEKIGIKSNLTVNSNIVINPLPEHEVKTGCCGKK